MTKKTTRLIFLTILVFQTSFVFAQQTPFSEMEVRQFSQSVVHLLVETTQGDSREGSGVIVSPNGIIFTARHLVQDAFSIRIHMFDQANRPPVFAYIGRINFISNDLDFAVVEIFADSENQVLDPSSLALPHIMDWSQYLMMQTEPVYIWSYPDIASGVLSSTSGIVSAAVMENDHLVYRVDALFANGSSGGLLINREGEFVGIPTDFYIDDETGGQLASFIPLRTICSVEPQACEYLPSRQQANSITEAELQHFMAENDDIAGLIVALDVYWGANPSKGGDWGSSGTTIVGPAVFWTDIFQNISNLPDGVSPLRVQGGWGIFRVDEGYAYSVPQPNAGGRYLRIDSPSDNETVGGCPVDSIETTSLASSGESLYSVGSGVLANVIRPFGYSQPEVDTVRELIALYPCVQSIAQTTPVRQGTNDRCITSRYHTNRIWFGSPDIGTTIQVKRTSEGIYTEIGRIDTPSPDTMAYVFEYELFVGDEICIRGSSAPPMNFRLSFGPDLAEHIKSWCLVLNDTMTPPVQNYCQ